MESGTLYGESSPNIPVWCRALGGRDLPDRIEVGGRGYRRLATFKHDFFAATGLYGDSERRVVLKLGRERPVLGIPMAWIGRFLARREIALYRLLEGTEGIPRFVGAWGPNGLVHDYVPGGPLASGQAVDDQFFPRLSRLLDAVHSRGIAYVDLDKRGNVLVDDRGRPCLIDFQISWRCPGGPGGRRGPLRRLLEVLQRGDRYHLMKHWRRHRPDQLTAEQLAGSRRRPAFLRLYGSVSRPLIRLRRWAGLKG